jgi:hypothetical protein
MLEKFRIKAHPLRRNHVAMFRIRTALNNLLINTLNRSLCVRFNKLEQHHKVPELNIEKNGELCVGVGINIENCV